MGRYYNPPAPNDPTDATFRRTVGHEFEYSSGREMADLLVDRGQAPLPDPNGYSRGNIHSYGCNCPAADDFPVHPTDDGTAPGGEYLIGGNCGVLFGSPLYYEATKALADAATQARPGVSTGVGGHTHVGCTDLDDTAKRRLVMNYIAVQDELAVLMAGSLDRARTNGYSRPKLEIVAFWTRGDESGFWSTPPERHTFYLPGRPTLNFSPSTGATVEFRGWNTTRAQWRMILSANVSAAMVEAAKQGREAVPGVDLVRHLAGLLQYDVVALIQRQQKAKGVTRVAD